jgi:hypothetical protein
MSEERRKSLEQLISKLMQERDELALQMHLGKEELKDEGTRSSTSWTNSLIALNRSTRQSRKLPRMCGSRSNWWARRSRKVFSEFASPCEASSEK